MSGYLRWLGMTLLVTALLLAFAAGKGLAQEGPSIDITAPAEGEVLSGPDVTVSVAISGFTISLPLEPKREPNKGHIVYFLDVEPFFDLPTPLGDDNMIHSGRFSETFLGVADGEHTIYVCLVYDDNTCIDPALTDSVQVSVGQPPPTAIPSPEVTPTPEAPPETPAPPSPSPAPTEEPPALETPAPAETPPASPTPTLLKPSPTVGPSTPAATPIPGLAPNTALEKESDFPVWWYAVVVGTAALIVVGALALWRIGKAGARR